MTTVCPTEFSPAEDDDSSGDYVVVGDGEDDTFMMSGSTNGACTFRTFASQVQDGNSVILKKVQEENLALKKLLEDKIEEYRNYLSTISDCKDRWSRALKQMKEENEKLKDENAKLADRLKECDEEYKEKERNFRLIEGQLRQAIEELRSVSNSDDTDPSMVFIENDSKQDALKAQLKNDLSILWAPQRIPYAVYILPKEWLMRHEAHVQAEFSENTKPEVPDPSVLLKENGTLKEELAQGIDFACVARPIFEKLQRYYNIADYPLKHDLVDSGELTFRTDGLVGRSSASEHSTSDMAISTSLPVQIDNQNADLVDAMQNEYDRLRDEKLALQCEMDLLKADNRKEQQMQENEKEQLRETIRELEQRNTLLLTTVRQYQGLNQHELGATGGQLDDGEKCPLCPRRFHTKEALVLHAGNCNG